MATARAIAQYDGITATDLSGNITFRFHADIADSSGNVGSAQKVDVVIASADTQLQMLTKITTAIVAAALSVGFTIARSDVLVDTFTRGQ